MASSGNGDLSFDRGQPLRTRVFLGSLFLLLIITGLISIGYLIPFSTGALIILVLIAGIPVAFLLSFWVLSPFHHGLRVLDTALRSYRDGDFSLRLAPPHHGELHEMVSFYNSLADLARDERGTIYQRELLLDTLVQSTPMAILLIGSRDRLLLANREARSMFGLKRALDQTRLEVLLDSAPPRLKNAVEQERDILFTLPSESETETWYLSQRRFTINTQPHRLIMIKRLTRELYRQEVQSWKKLIRLINHELNNTLAPIRSLLHSARTILTRPSQHHKLDHIFQSMEDVTDRLLHFLEDYAAFARLPLPRKEKVNWNSFLEKLQVLVPFRLENRLTGQEGFFDPAQLQQAMLNLLKNAREASPEETPIEVHLANTTDGGSLIQVKDRGRGMVNEAMEKALLPFFSTKKSGTGLGLPLCREIIESHGGSIHIHHREGGGMTVTCTLPE